MQKITKEALNIYEGTILSKVFEHAPRYIVSSFATSGIAFLMLKYYTTVFSPEEYGILSIYNNVMKYIILIIGLNMQSYSMRIYWDYEGEERYDYLSTMFIYFVSSALIITLIGVVFSRYIVDFVKPGTFVIYFLGLLGAGLFVITDYVLRILKVQYKSKELLKNNLYSSVINHLSSVGLINYGGLGIIGRQLGKIVGSISLFALLFSNSPLKGKLRLVFNFKAFRSTLILATPSIFNSGQSLLVNYFDQIYIRTYFGLSEVGIYSIAFFISRSISMVIEGISNSIGPITFKKMLEDYESAIIELESLAYKYYVLLLLLLVAISFFGKDIVSLITSESYSAASSILSIMVFGYGLAGFYKIPSLVLGFHKKVKLYPLISFFSAITNITLNIIWIPEYAMVGAAFASLISLIVYSLGVLIYANSYLSVKFKFVYLFIHMVVLLIMLSINYSNFTIHVLARMGFL
jgi:O-antigen/teichoic acid export membrane protein